MYQLHNTAQNTVPAMRLLPERTASHVIALPVMTVSKPVYPAINMPPELESFRKGRDNDCL